ncbi:MAG: Hsp20/alpha crystallin family protein [Thermodesulfovibrionales bacterium]
MAEATKDIQKREAAAPEGAEHVKASKVYTPAVDVIARKDDILILADMPGVDETSVSVTLEKNVLTLHGSVTPSVPENHRLAMSEYGVGDYRRVFTLSDEVDREKIQASVKNGVVRLVLPKADVLRPRKIEVRAES